MGNSASSSSNNNNNNNNTNNRANQRPPPQPQPQQQPQAPPYYQYPPQPAPYPYPPNQQAYYPPGYGAGYYPTAGQGSYPMPVQGGAGVPPYGVNQYGQAPRPTPTQEYRPTATIRNLVNLKKQTLALQPVEGSPELLSITFKFDASAPCRVTTFVNAREDSVRGCRIQTSIKPAPSVGYDKGLDVKFPPTNSSLASQHVVNTSLHKLQDLTKFDKEKEVYPIIIRLEAITEEGKAEGKALDFLEPGCELPHWVQSQTTYAKLVKEDDGSWEVKVIKQKIWVKGESYELQEIYGMEQNKTPGVVDGFEDVEGNECVICMSAPRDTTALPCRHMCMCHSCATALKNQTNKCPICRNEIDSLLHIKINRGRPADVSDATAPATALA